LIVNVSPAVTAFAVTVPENPNVPEELADHAVKNVYVSEPATLVHVKAMFDALLPPDEDANVACFLTLFVATFDVPAAPGAPTCN
jgi:hypothetical protein